MVHGNVTIVYPSLRFLLYGTLQHCTLYRVSSLIHLSDQYRKCNKCSIKLHKIATNGDILFCILLKLPKSGCTICCSPVCINTVSYLRCPSYVFWPRLFLRCLSKGLNDWGITVWCIAMARFSLLHSIYTNLQLIWTLIQCRKGWLH